MRRLGGKRSTVIVFGLVAVSIIAQGESFLDSGSVQRDSLSAQKRRPMCFSKPSVTEEEAATEATTREYETKTWNPLRLLVLRLGFTEPAMTSPLNYGKFDGQFTCAYCGQRLFDSDAKYDSGSGWPSFWRSADAESITYKVEFDGRLECQCKRCKSHLGHVFLDGPRPSTVPQDLLESSPDSDPRGKTGKYLPRFCVNGASLRFNERGDTPSQ